MLKFTGPMFLTTIVSSSGTWLIGRELINRDGGEIEFALFSIGLQWFSLTLVFPGIISRVILPRLVKSYANENNTKSSTTPLRDYVYLSTFVASLISMIGIVSIPVIRALYGGKYPQLDYTFVGFFFMAAVFSASINILGNAIVARGKAWNWLIYNVIWLVIILLSTKLTIAYGAIGVGFSFLFSYLVLAMISFFACKKDKLI